MLSPKSFGITPAYAGKTNLEYIDTKRVLLNNIPQRDSRGINLSPTAVISNTLAESITNILYKVKTEKDLADTKMENRSSFKWTALNNIVSNGGRINTCT